MAALFYSCSIRYIVNRAPVTISFDKSLVISYRHTDLTFLIPCINELNTKYIIDIFEKWIKPTVGLPYECPGGSVNYIVDTPTTK